MKNCILLFLVVFFSISLYSQKIDPAPFYPHINDTVVLNEGFDRISGADSLETDWFAEALNFKKSGSGSLMMASLWADEMVDAGFADQALNFLTQAGEGFKARNDTLQLVWAFYHKSLANYHYRKANYKERVWHHQIEGKVISHVDTGHPLLLDTYSQLMTAHWAARNVKKGFEYFDRVLDLCEKGEHDYYRVNAYLNALNILKFYNPSVAIEFADYTHYLANEYQKPFFLHDPYFYISLGSAHTAVNKHPEALKIYQDGLEVFKSSGAKNPTFLSSLYYYIGVTHKNLVYWDPDTTKTDYHYRRADAWLDSALVSVRQRMGESHPMYSRVINLKGQNLNNWERYEEALPVNQKAWKLVEKVHGRYNKYYSQQAINELARSQLRSGRFSDALETYHRQICYFLEIDDTLDFYSPVTIDTARFSDSHLELSRALVGKATALENLMDNPNDTAMISLILDHYAQALAVTDASASMALTTGGLQSVSAQFNDIGYRVVDFLTRHHFDDDAIERVYRMVSESKANALLAGMYRQSNGEATGRDSLAIRIHELEDSLQRLDAQKSGSRYENLMERFLEIQKKRFVSEFGKSRKVASIRLPRLANIDSRPIDYGIQKNEKVIDYFVTYNNLCRFEITNQGIRFFSTPLSDELDKSITNLFRGIKTGDNRLINEMSGLLYADLLGETTLAGEKLTIIPDGNLYMVPFEVLNNGSSPVIKSSAVTYRYSSHLFTKNPGHEGAELQSLTMFAPVFDNLDLAYNHAAQSRELNIPESPDLFRSGESNVLKQIPYTEAELEQIKDIFSQKIPNPNLFYRSSASESAFKKESRNASILHVATHGHADMRNPGNSGLFFVADDQDDGFLFMSEIFDLDLNADLVVLSACKTGAGEIHKGEGVMALPRGFIHAGVPNVLASMWKVHDENTKDLMVAFYGFLLKGHSYHDALRLAKLKCMENGFLPVDWAGFVMVEG